MKMEKMILAMAVLMGILINALTYVPMGGNAEEPKEENKSVTETFVIQSETQDGNLHAVSISEKTNAPYGYSLDNKYELGDVVEVTYWNDEIKSEKKITGKELEKLEAEKGAEINAVIEEGMQMYVVATCAEDEVLAEDNSCVNKSFYE